MLFDLRSAGRRRAVKVVYLGLALLMGGGLVLFGVGAGNGFGGLLNAFNGGSGGAATQVVSQQEKNAIKATKLKPSSPSAWLGLVQARYSSAGEGSNYNPNVINPDGSQGQYAAGGKKELTEATQDWGTYLKLVKSPDANTALLVARAYDALGRYADEAATWQIITGANSTNATTTAYYVEEAIAAYKGKLTRLGDLASAKALSLTPKAQQSTIQQQINQAKSAAATSTTTTAATG
jgi:hypothetical protein